MGESIKSGAVASADPMAYSVDAMAKLEHQELHRCLAGEKVSDFFILLCSRLEQQSFDNSLKCRVPGVRLPALSYLGTDEAYTLRVK